MGGDAIIVTRNPETRTMGAVYLPQKRRNSGQFIAGSARTIEVPRIQVAVIAWKAAS